MIVWSHENACDDLTNKSNSQIIFIYYLLTLTIKRRRMWLFIKLTKNKSAHFRLYHEVSDVKFSPTFFFIDIFKWKLFYNIE